MRFCSRSYLQAKRIHDRQGIAFRVDESTQSPTQPNRIILRFNRQVNRNRERFPEDFMFQLNEEEFANLRLQSATSSLKGSHGGRRYAPLAFTEHGAIMASMVLGSLRATALSVYVVRAFVELRGMLTSNQALANKVHTLERHIAELVDSLAQLLAAPPPPPKRSIGFITPEDKPAPTASKASKVKKTP
ncbi:MAG: ORF6N domain-containing protein [Ramlibacter sp.]|nr:ORF6N domain-containing protein [Ramlibacter sp.]